MHLRPTTLPAVVVALAVSSAGCGEVLNLDGFTSGMTGSHGGNSGGGNGGNGGNGATGASGGAGGSGGSGGCLPFPDAGDATWVAQFGGTGDIFVSDATLLLGDRVSVCGQTQPGSYSIVSPDDIQNTEADLDAYVFQLDSDGVPSWALGSNALGNDHCSVVAATTSDTLLGGTFTSTMALDPNMPLGGDGKPHAFVYGVTAGGTGTTASLAFDSAYDPQVATGVAPLSNGVIVAGIYHQLIGASGEVVTSNATDAAFVARVHSGTDDYLVDIGGSDLTHASSRIVHDLVADANSHAYVVGEFSGELEVPGSETLNSDGTDGFLVALGSTGDTLFAKQFGASGRVLVMSVALSPTGESLYVTGEHEGELTVDGITVPAPGEAGADGFLFKLSASDGAAVWAVPIGGSGVQVGRKLAVDDGGNIYVAGRLDGVLATADADLEGVHDSFVVSFDRDGSWRGGFVLEDGTANLLIGGLDVRGCSLMVAAQFGGTVDFGGVAYSAQGHRDALVLFYDLSPP